MWKDWSKMFWKKCNGETCDNVTEILNIIDKTEIQKVKKLINWGISESLFRDCNDGDDDVSHENPLKENGQTNTNFR